MEITEAIQAIQQPRSRFQLENFVLGQHDTIEMQFYQLCLELQMLMHSYETSEISIRRTELKIKRLLETGDEMDALEAEELVLGLEMQKVVMLGAKRELEIMKDIFYSIPHFTREEIEQAQPEYWQQRLTRQTNLQIMAGDIGWSQLDTMRQAGFLDKAIEDHEANMALMNGHAEVTA
tara:strand:+ start:1099 stop:1632 length:534 start_codon:yes stop_codon:yes gene_type:complete